MARFVTLIGIMAALAVSPAHAFKKAEPAAPALAVVPAPVASVLAAPAAPVAATADAKPVPIAKPAVPSKTAVSTPAQMPTTVSVKKSVQALVAPATSAEQIRAEALRQQKIQLEDALAKHNAKMKELEARSKQKPTPVSQTSRDYLKGLNSTLDGGLK